MRKRVYKDVTNQTTSRESLGGIEESGGFSRCSVGEEEEEEGGGDGDYDNLEDCRLGGGEHAEVHRGELGEWGEEGEEEFVFAEQKK